MLSGTEAAMAAAEYTVIVQGQRFQLSRAQLEFDSPNLLSEYFLNHKHESGPSPREIKLPRNPGLFLLILEYLCGYKILPVDHHAMPFRMSQENVLDNLRADATYYNLQGLVRLIDRHVKLHPQPETVHPPNDTTLPCRKSPPIFHFPGRVVNWSRADHGINSAASGYMEFPISIDVSKSFSIVCWFKAASNKETHTLIALETPSVSITLFDISIMAHGDFRFEFGTDPDAAEGRIYSETTGAEVRLGVWTHLTFVQQVDQASSTHGRKLYLDGKVTGWCDVNSAIYNPSPQKTRMVIMRGSYDHMRNAGFLGQAEDIAVFQRALDQEEITTRALRCEPPADHGWQTDPDGISGLAY